MGNTNIDGMRYEDMPLKKSKKDGIRVITEMPTYSILWHVAMRHKFGLVMTYALGTTTWYLVERMTTVWTDFIR